MRQVALYSAVWNECTRREKTVAEKALAASPGRPFVSSATSPKSLLTRVESAKISLQRRLLFRLYAFMVFIWRPCGHEIYIVGFAEELGKCEIGRARCTWPGLKTTFGVLKCEFKLTAELSMDSLTKNAVEIPLRDDRWALPV